MLINLCTYPVANVLQRLLQDKTTGENIVFASDSYKEFGITPTTPVTPAKLKLINLTTRTEKRLEDKKKRTKGKAEVFTPSWICNRMNNHIDEDWFGYKDVFTHETDDKTWTATAGKVAFPQGKTWKDYVKTTQLEITCGEAPFLASRYDTTNGQEIDISNRIGLLDRKLRVINENTHDEKDWLKWVMEAYKSTYGYEYQGDNLVIARINLLMTFAEYLKARWGRDATNAELAEITDVICWNIWQMDGLTGTVPCRQITQQLSLFDTLTEPKPVECIIRDWNKWENIPFSAVGRA
jgi:hypothetical protein